MASQMPRVEALRCGHTLRTPPPGPYPGGRGTYGRACHPVPGGRGARPDRDRREADQQGLALLAAQMQQAALPKSFGRAVLQCSRDAPLRSRGQYIGTSWITWNQEEQILAAGSHESGTRKVLMARSRGSRTDQFSRLESRRFWLDYVESRKLFSWLDRVNPSRTKSQDSITQNLSRTRLVASPGRFYSAGRRLGSQQPSGCRERRSSVKDPLTSDGRSPRSRGMATRRRLRGDLKSTTG
jgi:hypothetical protein